MNQFSKVDDTYFVLAVEFQGWWNLGLLFLIHYRLVFLIQSFDGGSKQYLTRFIVDKTALELQQLHIV